MKKLILACALFLCSLLLNLAAVTAQVIATISLVVTPTPHTVQRSIRELKSRGWKLLQVYKTGCSETAPHFSEGNPWLAIMLDPDQNQKAVVIYENSNYFVYP